MAPAILNLFGLFVSLLQSKTFTIAICYRERATVFNLEKRLQGFVVFVKRQFDSFEPHPN